jgi:tRNA threonylcarbamoyladenosine biosynthesis protein TsaE
MPDRTATGEGIEFSQVEISQVAKELLKAGEGQFVWALYGSMGAGKTTLTKAIVAELGVQETVTSPTFSIVNEYRGSNEQQIYHFDFYRIKNEIEAYDLGIDEYFDSGHLCLVEWPEKIPTLLPPNHFEIQLKIIGKQTRLIQYATHG